MMKMSTSPDTTTTITNLEENEMAIKKKTALPKEQAATLPAPVAPQPKFNKSALIRGYLESNPNIKPTELGKVIMEQHPGVTIHSSEIYNLRTKMNAPTGAKTTKNKSSSSGTFVANLKAFQDAVHAVGGPNEAAELLKMLS